MASLPGKPDIVFPRRRLAVFCDGDFWHGKDWESRRKKLARGTNSSYWIAKIERNRARDLNNRQALEAAGWTVLRFWESEIRLDTTAVAARILSYLDEEEGAKPRLGLTRGTGRRKKGVR